MDTCEFVTHVINVTNMFAFQVACSGENKAAFHTVTVVCLIVSLEVVMNYHSKLREGGYFKADVLRPVAAHCIGYPLVSIGMCRGHYRTVNTNTHSKFERILFRLLSKEISTVFIASAETRRSRK